MSAHDMSTKDVRDASYAAPDCSSAAEQCTSCGTHPVLEGYHQTLRDARGLLSAQNAVPPWAHRLPQA